MSRGIFPSSSLCESGLTRIGANARIRPMPDVWPHLSRTSLGNGGSTPQAPMHRVSDQDGAAVEVARNGSVQNQGKLSPHTGMNSHGAKEWSGQAAMSGHHGMTDRGPEHHLQPPDGHGCPEHDQQSRTARRCLVGSIRSALYDRDHGASGEHRGTWGTDRGRCGGDEPQPLTAIEAAAWTSSSVPMTSIDRALLAEVKHLSRALVVPTIYRVSGRSRSDI